MWKIWGKKNQVALSFWEYLCLTVTAKPHLTEIKKKLRILFWQCLSKLLSHLVVLNCGGWWLGVAWCQWAVVGYVNSHDLNPFDAEVWIFYENYINTMAADTLATCVAMSSTVMILSKIGRSLLSMSKDLNHLHHPSAEKILHTLRPIQNSCHFPYDIFKGIFLNENVRNCD